MHAPFLTILSGKPDVLDTDDTQIATESQLDKEAMRLALLNCASPQFAAVPDPPATNLIWWSLGMLALVAVLVCCLSVYILEDSWVLYLRLSHEMIS